MKVKGLSGIILSSSNPERLAKFYIDVMGIPMKLSQHGSTPEHWECDFRGIHFAILRTTKDGVKSNNITPSFYVDDIDKFVSLNNIQTDEITMDLGNAFSLGFKDPDNNNVRLWMHKNGSNINMENSASQHLDDSSSQS